MFFRLDVPGNKLLNDPEKITEALEILSSKKNKIVAVELSHFSLGVKVSLELGKAMKDLPNLKRLNLSDCFVTRGDEELPKCLGNLMNPLSESEKLEYLDLSDNALGPKAEKGYLDFFSKNKSLKHLYINNCGMGPVGTPNLIDVLSKNSALKLETLSYARNKMESKGCLKIAEYLKNNDLIQKLVLSDNEINKEGLEKLLEVLVEKVNIKYLDIHNNTVADKYGMINKALKNLKNIEYLDISDVTPKFTKEEAEETFDIIKDFDKLKTFRYDYNLSEFDLDYDEFYELQRKIFCKLLNLPSIKIISLTNNTIDKKLNKEFEPKFRGKNIELICYDEEELENNANCDDDLDNTDLNK